MDLDEVDTRLRLLDQALAAGDYPAARVRLFGLLYGIDLAERSESEAWRRQWLAPVQQRVLPLYTLLVDRMRKELRTQERRTKSDGDESSLRQVIRRQRQAVAQALFAEDADDRRLSVRALGTMARDPKALSCIDQSRKQLEGYLAILDRAESRPHEERQRERERARQEEVERLRREANKVPVLELRERQLHDQVRAWEGSSRAAEDRAGELAASVRAREEALQASLAEQQRLQSEAGQERAERRRHEERLSHLEQQAAERERQQRREAEQEKRRYTDAERRWKERQQQYEAAEGDLRDRLEEREQTIAELRRRVAIEDQARQQQYDLILSLAKDEEEALRQGEVVPAHEEYGVLIAYLWLRAAEQYGMPVHDFRFFQEELEALLDHPATLSSLTGHSDAVAAFNEYQSGRSPIADMVADAGYGYASRDELLWAFAEQWPQWKRQHRARMEELFLRFRSGTLGAQGAVLHAWLRGRGINPEVLSSDSFVHLTEDHPEMLRNLVGGPPEPEVSRSHLLLPADDSPFGV